MEALTKEEFKEKIFDIDDAKEIQFKGERPCIVDFYADWCGPCKQLGPVLEDISKEYKGRVDVFKVNVDGQSELAQAFSISSVPSLLFVTKEGKARMAVGALPRSSIVQAIREVLGVEASA